jgi:hypothetical protein
MSEDQLPDDGSAALSGFEELAAHNLVSFKSYQEALDGWALLELLCHYVNYRKQVSPSMQDLLPEEDFRLFAVRVRHICLTEGSHTFIVTQTCKK